jgi:hypothetical protein
MGIGVSPVDGGGLVGKPNQTTAPSTQQMIAAFTEGAKVIDTEVQAMSKDMMGAKKVLDGGKPLQKEALNSVKSEYVPNVQAELEAELTKEQSVDRLKRKKTKWEAKMDELASLEGEVGFEQLQGEEKSIFSQFFDNMARIRSLRAKLKQLERQEELLEEEKQRKRLEEQNEERRRRLKEMQNGESDSHSK